MDIELGENLPEQAVLSVSIDETANKIGVLCSGGMDSTLLLWMLIQDKEIRNLDTEIHCFTADQPGRFFHSANVLSLPEFKSIKLHHTDVPNDAPEGVRPIINVGWVLYSGANRNPEEDIGGRYPPRKYNDPLPKNLHFPFRYLFKYHILSAYFKAGISHILPYTSSCTELDRGRCGLCFACRERKWACDKLGISEI